MCVGSVSLSRLLYGESLACPCLEGRYQLTEGAKSVWDFGKSWGGYGE